MITNTCLIAGSLVAGAAEVGAEVPLSLARLPFELDGEQFGTTPVRFEVLPAALRVRVPRSRPDAD